VKHRHLAYPRGTPVESWPPAAVVDAFERGDLADWKPIAAAVARDPKGPFAARVMELVDAYPMYGTSPLWRAWIERRRAAGAQPAPAAPVGLAELRRKAGLTQEDVARRIGMSQSDLSKLERRSDVRVSTLRSYAEAIGGKLHLLIARGMHHAEVHVGATPGRTRRTRATPPRR
jgi:DNA-binding XRE family transcriptional regulator